jgi:hypothetical protein
MEHTKQKLGQLIATINDTFPDETDLKGFPGISKQLILSILTDSDTLMTSLLQFDNAYETIILKRELAEIFEKINTELEGKFEKIKPEKFNSFIKHIAKIKLLTKETFISVASDTIIRTEAQVLKTNEELNLLTSNIEALKQINTELLSLKDLTIQNATAIQTEATTLRDEVSTLKNEVEGFKNTSATIVADFQEKQRIAIENESRITTFLGTIEQHKIAVEGIKDNTTQWQNDIKAAKENLETKVEEFDKLNVRSKEVQKEIEITHEKIFGKKDEDGKQIKGYQQETEDLKIKMANFLEEQEKIYSAQFAEIKSLLPDATSAGLAAAYQKQKESYDNPILIWTGVFFVTILAMTVLGSYIIYKYLQTTGETTLNNALISLLKDLPFFIPTIWLAAFASKQQSQYKRLQQEYAFKETNAKSFHGHKEQIERLMKDSGADKEMLSALVAQLVVITAQNPSNTLDNKSHEDSPPIFKVIEKYFPSSGSKKDNA